MLQPNEAGVLTLFGDYLGTERKPGLRWTWPWNMRRKRVSVRARNHNIDTLKVNDKRGNPVEIAAVVVWRVEDTAQALFDVEDFENFVQRAERVGAAPRRHATTTTTPARTTKRARSRCAPAPTWSPTRCAPSCRCACSSRA